MSDRDVLAAASRALREETARSPRRIALPRRRDALVETLRARRVTARRITASMVAMLTVLVASGAWATVTGRLPLSKFVRAIVSGDDVMVPRNESPTPMRSRDAQVVPRATAPRIEATPSEPAPSVRLPEPILAVEPATTSHAARASHAPRIDPHDDLYRAAHLAQFVQHDPVAAVAAWDRYLAVTPGGRFAVEAAYNRALSLVRLGRYEAASAALLPFARGDHGPYRQREARELIARLPPLP